MELRIETCSILPIQSGEKETAEGIELPNQERVRKIEENVV